MIKSKFSFFSAKYFVWLIKVSPLSQHSLNVVPNYYEKVSPGQENVEQHQGHAEYHPGGETERVTRSIVSVQGVQDNKVGRGA